MASSRLMHLHGIKHEMTRAVLAAKYSGRPPAFSFSGISRTRIAENRSAPHLALQVVRIEPGRGMHEAAIIPHYQVAALPFMYINELRLRHVGHQLFQKSAPFAVRTRF